MNNEHITDEMIKDAIDSIDWSQMVTADDYPYMIARAAIALRPAAQPAATHIGSLNTREQIFQNGCRIGFKAGQQTVTAAPAAQPVAVPDRVPMPDEVRRQWEFIRESLNKPSMYRDRISAFVEWFGAQQRTTPP